MEPPQPQKPIQSNSSSYFAGRNQIGSKNVTKDTVLVGRRQESEVKGFMRTLSRWAFIIRHPKIYLRQREEDKTRRGEEVRSGQLHDTRHITDRRVSVDREHLQEVTKTMQSGIRKEKGGGFDPRSGDLDELHHVQKARAGFWADRIPWYVQPKNAESRVSGWIS